MTSSCLTLLAHAPRHLHLWARLLQLSPDRQDRANGWCPYGMVHMMATNVRLYSERFAVPSSCAGHRTSKILCAVHAVVKSNRYVTHDARGCLMAARKDHWGQINGYLWQKRLIFGAQGGSDWLPEEESFAWQLQEEAHVVAERLSLHQFKAFDGWLGCSKKRHNIRQFTVSREAADVSDKAVEGWHERLKSLMVGYEAEDV